MDPETQSELASKLVAARESPSALLAVLGAAGFSTERLRASVGEAPAPFPYARHALLVAPECEVMLARWSADRVCAPHDHGASGGWVFFLEGRFHEIGYRWNGRALVEGERIVRDSGTHAAVRADEIHSCASEAGGLSLHVYFPRIGSMRVFDLAKRRTLVVSAECGAWVPADPGQTLQVTSWSDPAPNEAS